MIRSLSGFTISPERGRKPRRPGTACGAAEQRGDPTWGVDNVLFTCANYRREDWLVIPYAAADSRIFGARLSFYELLATLEKKSAEVRHGKG